MPEKIGCYLCYTSDGWMMVCFVNVLGQWMIRPGGGGSSYGDLCGADPHIGAGKKRTITHWMPLPEAPIN